MVASRPYRVVFSYAGVDRPGTIVAPDLEAAHREARSVVEAGGTAVVQHVCGETGDREIIAIYAP